MNKQLYTGRDSIMDFSAESCLFNNPSGPRLCCHSASIIETQAKTLIAVWYAYEKDETDAATLVIVQKRKDNNYWDAPKFVFKESSFSLGNPCFYQEKGGRLWLIYVSLRRTYWDSANINGIYSDNDGLTWSAPQILWLQEGVMVRHNPVFLDDQRVLVAAYNESLSETLLLRSGESFNQWNEVFRFKEFPLIQPALVRLNKDDLLLFFRPKSDPRIIWRSASMDNGKTWMTPVKTSLKNPLTGLSAVAWSNKTLIFYNPNEVSRWPLSVSCSEDKGLSWTNPVLLENVDFEVSYPAFIMGSDGRCHGVFTYNRRKIKYIVFKPEEIWP